MDQIFKFEVLKEDCKRRLDLFLLEKHPSISRSQIKKLIEAKLVQVNEGLPKAGERLRIGDVVKVILPKKKDLKLAPENIPLDILYQDDYLIVLNKPPGLVVHPAPGNYSGTLVNALLYHFPFLSGMGGPLRPGIVHRLDKNTSGVMVVARNDFAYQALAQQFKEHSILRRYIALVFGV